MLYRIADRTISPWVFYQTGVAILIWPVNAPQPIATVLTSRGTFSAPLIGVSEGVREVITWGNYRGSILERLRHDLALAPSTPLRLTEKPWR